MAEVISLRSRKRALAAKLVSDGGIIHVHSKVGSPSARCASLGAQLAARSIAERDANAMNTSTVGIMQRAIQALALLLPLGPVTSAPGKPQHKRGPIFPGFGGPVPWRRGTPAPRDPIVHIGDQTTVVLPPVAGCVHWNALWSYSAERRQWTTIARRDDDLAGPARGLACQPMLLHWGVLAPGATPATPRVAEWRRNDGGWDVGSAPHPVQVCEPQMRPATMPHNIRTHCHGPQHPHSKFKTTQLGEGKPFTYRGEGYVYGYGRKVCRVGLSEHLTGVARANYRRNGFKNFIAPFGPRTANAITSDRVFGDPRQNASLLHYDEPPEGARSPVAKNFLLFQQPHPSADHTTRPRRRPLLAIALIEPHRIYRVSPRTGYMKAYAATHSRLGFRDPVGLSAGPVLLPGGERLLVAAHTRKGGFNRAMRLTFFYTCSARPPFQILEVTPLLNFGWSWGLEYLTHMELLNATLYVSLGIADCSSVLLSLPLGSVLEWLHPVPQGAASNASRGLL